MPGSQEVVAVVSEKRSQALLDFAHRLLLAPPDGACDLDGLLADLARVAGADAAGFACLAADGTPAVRRRVAVGGPDRAPASWPWQEQPELFDRLRAAPAGLAVHASGETDWLLTVVGQPGAGHALLWLEGPSAWDAADGAALTLAGQALLRQVPEGPAAWARQLDRALRQQRLEDAAAIARRLAHDFGNVLTSILGFTELSLAQLPRGSVVHGYLQEVHRATQQGAEMTSQLRLFSRRGTAPRGSTPLGLLLAAEAERLRAAWGPAVRLQLLLPSNLPPAGLDAEPLRQALLPLLANAREAIAGEGTVTVTAGLTELSPAACLDLAGNPRPGPCLEVVVHDTGAGLSPEARARFPGEPFFTTKPRHRGIGLAAVYGLMQLHGGGFRLGPAAEGGTLARLYLPAGLAPAEPATAATGSVTGRGEKVLVVDDDPMILQLVATTLERAGYQVAAVTGGAEAVAVYTAADEPFRLVLSDVLMPHLSGVELARRLLHHDPRLNLLFMSGHVSADFARANFGNWNFNLLQKPFRAEGLLHAVRTALDRGPQAGATQGVTP
jgi:signal transduction histidine kinase/ActR/RegA family two-component response regulator